MSARAFAGMSVLVIFGLMLSGAVYCFSDTGLAVLAGTLLLSVIALVYVELRA